MKMSKKILSLLMAAAMVLSMFPGAAVADDENANSLSYERLDPADVSVDLTGDKLLDSADSLYGDSEMVRVIIELEGAPALSVSPIDMEVESVRQELIQQQDCMAQDISDKVLDGAALEVEWNLTLVTNAMSVNVPYGSIEEIAAMDGVKGVFLEMRYEVLSDASTSNVASQYMTGANAVQNLEGYTGAGTRIAIIDTGTDTDHQSFSNDGYLYSLGQLAEGKGMSAEEYIAGLDLLDKEEIASVLSQLHIIRYKSNVTADELYINSKLPFGFNYIDKDLDITHDNDAQGEHGSHVAGIAAANRYLPALSVCDYDGDGDLDADDAQALMNFVVSGEAINSVTSADLSGDGEVTTYDVHLLLEILEGEPYAGAANTVGVTGTAPDAQIITMKVFGKSGGAYASDYIAAIEDAVILGCDVVNLSLGANYPGFTAEYGDYTAENNAFINGIMDRLADSDIVACVAAGNAGNWATNDDAYGYMYTDEAGTYNNATPSTYTNAMGIASVNNAGSVTDARTVFSNGREETSILLSSVLYVKDDYTYEWPYLWKSLDSIGKGTTYEVEFLGDPSALMAGEEQTDLSIYGEAITGDYTGKVLLIARGNMVAFADKLSNGAAAGAAAVIIYNNEPGDIAANVTGANATIPCVGISLDSARKLFEMGDDLTVTVKRGLTVTTGEDVEYPTMSDFSSWGPTGALTIKPEITAPGGSIYSVNGSGPATDEYEYMSGTSMASPHAAGLYALMAQYISDNGLLDTARAASGVADLSLRNLSQSLSMSTAEALIEEASGYPYSVRNQGAGLINIQSMTDAESFILVDGQPDGKVKAELGHDPQRTGTFTFTFKVVNLGTETLNYDLSNTVITTDTLSVVGEDGQILYLVDDAMTALDASVSYSCGNSVTVPAGGSASVTVTVQVSDTAVKTMTNLGYVNGFYVEGFITLTGKGLVTHSIPMLGWYGDWSDPSMVETGYYPELYYDGNSRLPHMAENDGILKNPITWVLPGSTEEYTYSGNVYNGTDSWGNYNGDGRYLEERNAISSNPDRLFSLYGIHPTTIRGSVANRVEIVNSKTGEVYYDYIDNNILHASFYYVNGQAWYDMTTMQGVIIGDEQGNAWGVTDMNGEPLPDGTPISITFTMMPELSYLEGTDWDDLGRGTRLNYNFTVDNIAPDLVGEGMTLSEDGNTLTVNVQDNRYIAAVVLLDGSASTAFQYYHPDMDVDAIGTEQSIEIDLTEYRATFGNKAAIVLADYAGNETYYAINLGGEGQPYGDFIGMQFDTYYGDGQKWVSFSEGVNCDETILFDSALSFTAAEYVNGYIFAQAEDGKLYGIPYADMLASSIDLESYFVAQLENVYNDLAYNYSDGKLYGLHVYEYTGWGSPYPYTEIYSINLNGAYFDEENWVDVEAYDETWVTQYGSIYALTMAIDDAGTFYFTALEYVEAYDEETYEDISYYDPVAQLWTVVPELVETDWYSYVDYYFEYVGSTGVEMDFLQSMTWNHNDEQLYWAHFAPVDLFTNATELFRVNTETAEVTKVGLLSDETACLMAPLSAESAAKTEHSNVPAMDNTQPAAPILNSKNLTLNVGSTYALTYNLDPWYSTVKDMVWSSSDESVATVDQSGLVTAVANGSCEITVSSKAAPYLSDTCTVNVAALSLNIEGVISAQGEGVGSAGGTRLYRYEMRNGQSSMTLGDPIAATEEMNFGLSLATSVMGRGSIWASEYGNTGMVYEINPETGAVVDALQPVDGDMLFGMTYSESQDTFSAIMDMYLYIDQPLNAWAEDQIIGSYDEETNEFMWRKIDMLPYLIESNTENFVTGETGNGASSEIVFCGITTIDGGILDSYGSTFVEDSYKTYLGEWDYSGTQVMYQPTQTLVLLDNVGRLWYIDEVCGLTRTEDEYGNVFLSDENGSYITGAPSISYDENWNEILGPTEFRSGVTAIDIVDENGNESVSAVIIRKIVETPLTDMFREGTLPRLTYHFSDIEFAGYHTETNEWGEETNDPIFFMSLYDYWNNGTTNELYLYIPGHETGEMDYDTWEPISTPDQLFHLGNTGNFNIIASIHKAEFLGGLGTEQTTDVAAPTAVGVYTAAR